jgi:hypothetical protein
MNMDGLLIFLSLRFSPRLQRKTLSIPWRDQTRQQAVINQLKVAFSKKINYERLRALLGAECYFLHEKPLAFL